MLEEKFEGAPETLFGTAQKATVPTPGPIESVQDAGVAPKKRGRGRPTIGARPMTHKERVDKTRAKQRANRPLTQEEVAYRAQKLADYQRAEAIRLEKELIEDIIYGIEELKDGVGDGGDYNYLEDLIDEYLTPLEVQYDLIHGGWDHVQKFERFYFDLITKPVGRAILTHLGVELPPELPDGWFHFWIHGGDGGWHVVRKPYCWPRLPFAEYTGNEALLVWAHRWDRHNPPATPENSQGSVRPKSEEDAAITAQSIAWHLGQREQKQAQHAARLTILKARYREARGKRVTQSAPAVPNG